MSNSNEDNISTPEERLNWLRERGVQIETSEDRKKTSGKEDDEDVHVTISYVRVPHDTSKPMLEITIALTEREYRSGDNLPRHLKSAFATLEGSDESVDLELLRNQATRHLASSGGGSDGSDVGPTVSDATMRRLAAEGQVEIFPLVRPAPSNRHTGVNVYLDEVGMLKRLPLNARAADLAARAGYDPPPSFYGDVFLGRIQSVPTLVNKDFKLGPDTSPDASWLKTAVTDNLEHQMQANRISGNPARSQPSNAGENGVAVEDADQGYRWTQTEEEVEITVVVGAACGTKDVRVDFKRESLRLRTNDGNVDVTIDLFAAVDPDGCTWTLDKDSGELVVTCEKSEPLSWPRITV